MGVVRPVCCCFLACVTCCNTVSLVATQCHSVHLVPFLNAVELFLWTETWFIEHVGERNNMKIFPVLKLLLRDLSVCSIMQSMFSQCDLLLKICSVSLFYYDLVPWNSRLLNQYVLCVVFVSGFMFRPFCLVYILTIFTRIWLRFTRDLVLGYVWQVAIKLSIAQLGLFFGFATFLR